MTATSPRPAGGPAHGDSGWVRLGPWWVSRAGLDAIAGRLQTRRLLTEPVVYVVLRKTYHRHETPEQIAAWFARQLPDIVPLADEGFLRFVLAAVERPTRPERPEGRPGGETGGRP